MHGPPEGEDINNWEEDRETKLYSIAQKVPIESQLSYHMSYASFLRFLAIHGLLFLSLIGYVLQLFVCFVAYSNPFLSFFSEERKSSLSVDLSVSSCFTL